MKNAYEKFCSNKNKELLIVFAVAFFLRIGYVFVFPQEKVLAADAAWYDVVAGNIVQGHGFSYYPDVPTPVKTPLYPLFLSFIYFVFGYSYTIVRIIQALIGALTCLVIYFIAKESFNEKIAKYSAWFLALYPILIAYTGLILSETLFIFLFCLAVLFLIKGLNRTAFKFFVLAGFFFGVAALARPVALLLPFILSAVIIFSRKKLFLKVVLFLFVFCLTIAPWFIRNYRLFGVIIPCSSSSGYGIFVSGYMAEGHSYIEGQEKYIELAKEFEKTCDCRQVDLSIEFEKQIRQKGLPLIKKKWRNYLLVVAKRFPRYWWSSYSSVFGVDQPISKYLANKDYFSLLVRFGLLLMQGIFLILAFLGIIFSLKKWKNSLIFIWMLILIPLYFTGTITFDFCPRLNLPAMPYVFVFSSLGLFWFMEKITVFREKKKLS